MSRGGGSGKAPATPGRMYVTKADGTLEDVGVEATGKTGQGPRIWGANPHVSATTKLPKGTKLIIPGDPPPVKIKDKAPDDLTCVIGGREVKLQTAKVVRTMDTGADGWSGRIPWTPGLDPKLDQVTRPFGYERAAIYIGNNLVVNGCLYVVEPEMTPRGMMKGLTGYSFTADAIDSMVMPPYEMNGLGLLQIAIHYARALGISVKVDANAVDGKKAQVNKKGEVLISYEDFKKGYDPFGGAFPRVCAHEGEKIFDFLAKLAAQRGLLLSCTTEGDFLFLRANTEGTPVGTLQESKPFVTGWKATYDGRKRWHSYKCITVGVKGREPAPQIWGKAKVGKTLPSTVTELDDDVPRSRFLTFRADEVTPGNVKHAARWKRNKSFADALTIPFPVAGWFDPNGKLWEVNTLVTVVSPTLGVPQGYTFLVRSVEFELDERRGREATLHLVPPQVFSGKDLGEVWSV